MKITQHEQGPISIILEFPVDKTVILEIAKRWLTDGISAQYGYAEYVKIPAQLFSELADTNFIFPKEQK